MNGEGNSLFGSPVCQSNTVFFLSRKRKGAFGGKWLLAFQPRAGVQSEERSLKLKGPTMNTTSSLPLPPQADAPTVPVRTPVLPVHDPLRTVPDVVEAIRLDCQFMPHEYIWETMVFGGGE
jgi:hypothetical protein